MAFIGNTNTTQAFTPAVDFFSGNGSTTAFTLSRPVASVAQVQVTIDNVAQNPSSAFTVSANTITFTSAPLSGTNNIYVYYTSPITQVIAPGQGTVTATSFVSSTGTGAGVFQTSPTINTPTLTSPITTGSTPQVTTYTSGSGTYTVPTGVRYLQVKMVGGGGGGGGSGSSGGVGGTGGTTTFGTSTLTCNGGTGGVDNGAGGTGGSATITVGSGLALSGGNGGGAPAGSGNRFNGGMGGASAFGGNGSNGGGDAAGAPGNGPQAGVTNTGGGGGGAAFVGTFAAGGGAAGGYIDAIITSLSATYSYAVGAAGTAGTAGTGANVANGGAGGSGVIIVTAFF